MMPSRPLTSQVVGLDTVGKTWQLSGSLVPVGMGPPEQRYVKTAGGHSVIFSRNSDVLSAQLHAAVTGGYVIPQLTLVTPAGKVLLTNARLGSATPAKRGSLKDTNEYEEIQITFQKIEFTWTDGGKTAQDDWDART